MKTTLTIIAIAAFAVNTYAQMEPLPKGTKHVIKCPVTGDKLDRDKATKTHMYADYKGNRYFFCCAGCPEQFKANPAKYKNKQHTKTPKVKAKTK